MNHQLPIINYQLPITNYQLSITNYQLPITNYPLPITNYQLPITNCQLPITLINAGLERSELNGHAQLSLLRNYTTSKLGKERKVKGGQRCKSILSQYIMFYQVLCRNG